MTSWVESHNNAMGFSDDAMRAKRRGHHDDARELFEKALSAEREALKLMEGVVDEPIYSTMYRSAATLALDCERYRLAEQLAYMALAGDPPGNLVSELRDVADQARLYTDPSRDGNELREDEINVAISGEVVKPGLAPWSDFVPRLNGVRRLLGRIWDFVDEHEHSDMSGARPDGASILIGTLEPGSIAVKMRIVEPGQERLPGTGGSGEVIKKTLQTIKAVNEPNESELTSLIPIEAYRRTFINLVKDIAPDGRRVSQVRFAGVVDGKEVQVPLRRTKASFNVRTRTMPEAQHKNIVGRLRYADGFRKLGDQIKIIDKNDEAYQVVVRSGEIDGIVDQWWNKWVEAKCIQEGETLTLESIDKADAPPIITEEMGC